MNRFLRIFLLISYFPSVVFALNCLYCSDVVEPADCDTIMKCGSHEYCYTDTYVSASGSIRYNLGCRDTQLCGTANTNLTSIATTHNPLVDVDNSTVNTSGVADDDIGDLLICTECCSSDFCSASSCGNKGYSAERGLLCFNCESQLNPDDCSKISLCGRDEICMVFESMNPMTKELRWASMCRHPKICSDKIEEMQAFAALFSGKRDASYISIGDRCIVECCSEDLCNDGCRPDDANSTSSTSPVSTETSSATTVTTPPPTTTTRPPTTSTIETTRLTTTITTTQKSTLATTTPSPTAATAAPTTPHTTTIFSPTKPQVVVTMVTKDPYLVQNPCLSNPCQRGDCSKYIDTFMCTCHPGYWGRQCEFAFNPVTVPPVTIAVAQTTTQTPVHEETTCCPDTWWPYQGSCYHVQEEMLDWNEAETYCEQKRAELVTIETSKENTFIASIARKLYPEYLQSPTAIWIGANDLEIEGSWKWLATYENVTTAKWDTVHGQNTNDRDCAAIVNNYSFNWIAMPCNSRLAYPLCEIRWLINISGSDYDCF